MRNDVKMINKSKNSFIYFQIGIIATMIIVLAVLELNIADKNIVYTKPKIDIPIEEVFTYTLEKKIEPIVKTIEKKVVVKEPKSNVITDKIKITNDEVKQDVIKDEVADDKKNDVSKNDDVKKDDDNNIKNNTSAPAVYTAKSVEKLPMFVGCENVPLDQQMACFEEKMTKHIMKHFSYPDKAVEKRIEGRVFVSFVINKEGFVTDIKMSAADGKDILKGEAERIIKKLPRFKPGMQGGVEVAVSYAQPISFKLKNE